MFRKILVPVDGSPNSYRGLRYASDIAKRYDAELTMVHVVERESSMGTDPTLFPIPTKYFVAKEEYAKSLMARRRVELEDEGVKVKTLISRGNPAAQVLKVAKEYDLIVIGSRGLGGFKKLMLGSVSGAILEHSDVPVLLVKPG